MYNIHIGITLMITVALSVAVERPVNFKRCDIHDDNCLNDAIQDAIARITKTGLRTLNVPILDPMSIPSIEFGTNGSMVNIFQKYDDMKLYGFSQSTVSNAHTDVDKKYITFKTKLPNLKQESMYDINGKVMVLPIVGKGRSIYNLRNPAITHTIHFEEKIVIGNNYLKVKSYIFEATIEGVTVRLDNLFNGNKELSDTVHTVLNENWSTIWEELKTGLQEAFGVILANYADRVFSKIPTKDIFL